MITLYHSGGAGDFRLLNSSLRDEDFDALLFNVTQLLAARGETQGAGLLATIDFSLSDATNDFGDDFCVLHANVPLVQYEHLRSAMEHGSVDRQEYKAIFQSIADTFSEIGPHIRFVVCYLDQSIPPNNWRSNLATSIALLNSNQALFSYKDSPKLVHEGLIFRSKTEIKIFNTLIKKGLLVLPLPVTVMGKMRSYKEPDFVVCHKGKVGILEIHGDKWHPPETFAKENERRREFAKLGINIYEVFAATRCWDDPDGVVNEFLEVFTRY
ncbi:MAG: hypothetical protein R3E39_14425 [Anaerolineae bacterium]